MTSASPSRLETVARYSSLRHLADRTHVQTLGLDHQWRDARVRVAYGRILRMTMTDRESINEIRAFFSGRRLRVETHEEAGAWWANLPSTKTGKLVARRYGRGVDPDSAIRRA